MPRVSTRPIPDAGRPFHLLAKPVGPACNLDCQYCFYLEKSSLYPGVKPRRMSDAVLQEFIRQHLQSRAAPEVHFAWQGGEPTLAGVDFFRRAVALQKRFAGGKTVCNAIQTNGTLLDEQWCEFLAANRFLVGLSIDGPRELHDLHRADKRGRPTFDRARRGLELLRRHNVEFNTLTVVHRENARQPLAVYRFLKSIGSRFMQFIPLVERPAPADLKAAGYDFAGPPQPGAREDSAPVTPWSVEPEQYGEFLRAIFDEWVRQDVGRTFVQLFDVALSHWMGLGSPLCVFGETCGGSLAIEHNGDVFSCDHYVYPRHKLGNVMNQSLGAMANSPAQIRFGNGKLDALPGFCRECDVRFACNGECPKHRFLQTPDGEPGLNYLCAAYRKFFRHMDPHLRTMARLLRNDEAPARVMELLAEPPGAPERPAPDKIHIPEPPSRAEQRA